uniref:DUF6824 domain-containing protein n=1 Tax=Craspedostauros australis TaxID=1486917 RepID=A0A7R9WP52_9STRA|mmetsp:Transcript_12724/g.35121  ORF Transcript_12724/g.35121 Transcript_12724/m.35121 type:complete len:264 (+) Transcript_12724:403-1194(+)|eukprot:CAMPEP_0198130516 /NCGR_PEP_ID=MMETSP1442-20131203/54158_1 /TAXON_ID= /ORGANISM="Craspedostauros australis, Strain CCMP3328" /LENGTH=263 /DNA_ID=CAMNT_0043791151 /DNA_START=385 /DNA_END=1176 /DNA_ORIENTATION=-
MSVVETIAVAAMFCKNRRDRDQRELMPESFEPTKYSVLLGRGKTNINWFGNRRLRIICEAHLKKYSQAKSRSEKSAIVTAIVDTIVEACPSGGFYKKQSGRWYRVEEELARDKVGCILRDSLADKYKSSTKNKVAKRRERRESGRAPMSQTKRSSFASVVSFTDSSFMSCASDDMSTSAASCRPFRRSITSAMPLSVSMNAVRRVSTASLLSTESGSGSSLDFDFCNLDDSEDSANNKKSFDQCWSELIQAGCRIQPIVVPTN